MSGFEFFYLGRGTKHGENAVKSHSCVFFKILAHSILLKKVVNNTLI